MSKNATPVAPDSLDDLLETMGVKFRSSLSDEQFDKIKVDSEAAIRLHYRQRVLAVTYDPSMKFTDRTAVREALLGIFGEPGQLADSATPTAQGNKADTRCSKHGWIGSKPCPHNHNEKEA